MRKLRLVLARSSAGLPILVAAACSATSSAVGETTTVSPGYVRDGGQPYDAPPMVDLITDITYVPEPKDVPPNDASAPGDAASACPSYAVPQTVTIPLPPEGTPAKLADVCASSSSPVESGPAAWVTLTDVPADAASRSTGRVYVAPELASAVVGLPVVSCYYGKVSNVRRDGSGFTFDIDWGLWGGPSYSDTAYISITVQIACGDAEGSIRLVQTSVRVASCVDSAGQPVWKTSGDDCTYCITNVCEMAPSPILPPPEGDALPLGRALDLRLKCIGRVGRALVLLAEHGAGDAGTDYRWHISAGHLAPLDRDVVVWTLPDTPGPHLAQIALEAEGGAAVASLQLAA